LIKK
jgi:hypothetical protein